MQPSRCLPCQRRYDQARDAQRGSSTFRGYGVRWRRLSTAILAEHRRTYGDLCPGWNREPHAAIVLTIDHIRPRSAGGTDERGNLQVLCRGCNSAKHTRYDQS